MKKNIVNETMLFINEPLAVVENGKEIVKNVQWIGIVIDNYYTKSCTHFFYVKCLYTNYKNKIKIEKNKTYKRQGKILYKNSVIIKQPDDIENKTQEKRKDKQFLLLYKNT